jgi:hypothetical protein
LFEHLLGIGSATEGTHTVLLVVQPKVFGRGLFGRRFWLRKCAGKEIFRIKIGCAFFVTFFAQAKKVNELAKQCAIERFLRGGNITTDFTKEAAIYYLSYYAD